MHTYSLFFAPLYRFACAQGAACHYPRSAKLPISAAGASEWHSTPLKNWARNPHKDASKLCCGVVTVSCPRVTHARTTPPRHCSNWWSFLQLRPFLEFSRWLHRPLSPIQCVHCLPTVKVGGLLAGKDYYTGVVDHWPGGSQVVFVRDAVDEFAARKGARVYSTYTDPHDGKARY